MTHGRSTTRPWGARLLVLLTLLSLGLALRWVLGDGEYVVADPPRDQPVDQTSGRRALPAPATRVLADLVGAVEDRDADAGATLGDESSSVLLGELVANAQALDVEDFSMRYVDEVGAVAADGTWSAAVEVSWRFDGYDDGVARAEVLVGFGPDPAAPGPGSGGVVVTGLGGGERRTPLWFTGALQVRATPETLVLLDGTAEQADLVSARAVAALPVVRRVLPAWAGPLVVEVPESGEQLDALLAAEAGTYAAIAAVTATVDGSTEPDAPLHVFLNPAVYDVLEPIGAQVVISHEATHVATDAPRRAVPTWLLEGFADYVALRQVDLPVSTTAAQVIEQVRRDGPPEALPDPADFEGASVGLGAAYEAAWLVCSTLADLAGEEALVRIYQRVSAGEDVAAVLRAEAGLGVVELTRAWQDRLTGLAG